MKEYKVVQSTNGRSGTIRAEFEVLVNAALADGWECQGGVFINGATFSQAMVKEKGPTVLNG